VFPLAFLASVEESIGGPIVEFFDLVVGTSTGGIIALGLGLGFSASEMLGFCVDLIPRIFQGNRIWRTLRSILVAKWDNKVLRTMLAEKFGSRKLDHSKVRLVIPAQDAVSGQVHLYKTAHHPRFEKDYLVDAVDIALATAAAPPIFRHSREATAVCSSTGALGRTIRSEWQLSRLRRYSSGSARRCVFLVSAAQRPR
jgi:patatin-like phospholipase/acyl hydrolase